MRILTLRQESLKKVEREFLGKLQQTLIQFGVIDNDIQTIIEAINQLDELFLLVIVGEFNSGKSAFINALLGEKLLQEGVTPTTNKINIIRYGKQNEHIFLNEHLQEILLPVDWLKETCIVDTPGTNAIIRSHEEITSQFIPRSDLVLFITSVDRPFTQSERAFLGKIHDWGKKIVFVINKIDILQDEDELLQVKIFVTQNAQELIGTNPEIFPLSARLALSAKTGNPSDWQKSRFEALETYIQETLDKRSRVLLKLLNPIGVGIHLAKRYLEIVKSRIIILKDDIDMLSDVESQLDIYQQDMDRDFALRMASIENILYEMEQRGTDYFDSTFRLARVFDLLSKDRIAREFEKVVISDLPERIEKEVTELIDWLVESDLRQWQAINEHIGDRRKTHQDRIVGQVGLGTFQYDRERLINALGKEAQNIVDSYDKYSESKSIAEDAQIAVAASAAIEIGAVGLGTIVAVLATTASADITGVLLASVVAALGLFVIPARRKMAKDELREKTSELRTQLTDTLRSQFDDEISKSIQKINNAIAPYTRFVRAENNKLKGTQEQLSSYLSEFLRLQEEIKNS